MGGPRARSVVRRAVAVQDGSGSRHREAPGGLYNCGDKMAQRAERLDLIKVSGFKSAIDPVELRVADLTILAGQNSAGKSTMMQPLLMVKQTIEKPYDPGGIAIDGPLVRFTSVDQFLSRKPGKQKAAGYELCLGYGDQTFTFGYQRTDVRGISLVSQRIDFPDSKVNWKLGQRLGESDPFVGELIRNLLKDGRQGMVIRDRAILVPGVSVRRNPVPDMSEMRFLGPTPAHRVIADSASMVHLPGLRGNPERSYPVSAGGPRYPGSFNDYVATILYHWKATKDDRLELIGRNLRALGLTWRATAERLDDTRVEIRVGRLPTAARGGARDLVNIADVGFGVSQTLPVLVALLAAEPGQLVFIEQPELHLHPKAQVALAALLVEAAKRGVRVIAETHSSLLILALQTLIARGDIDPEKISMNWFTRDAAGQTHVAEAKIGLDGSYGDWPVDFDSIELRLHDEYLTLVEARHG